jgi:hypothetical protein
MHKKDFCFKAFSMHADKARDANWKFISLADGDLGEITSSREESSAHPRSSQ